MTFLHSTGRFVGALGERELSQTIEGIIEELLNNAKPVCSETASLLICRSQTPRTSKQTDVRFEGPLVRAYV
jgi:hypothetical protein